MCFTESRPCFFTCFQGGSFLSNQFFKSSFQIFETRYKPFITVTVNSNHLCSWKAGKLLPFYFIVSSFRDFTGQFLSHDAMHKVIYT